MDPRVDSTLKSYFEINDRLSEAMERWLNGPEVLADGAPPVQLAVLPMLPKAVKLHRSIVRLCADGDGEDALVLLRALQELALYARYIAQEPFSERAERWIQFSVVARYEFLQTYLEDPDFAETRKRIDPNDPTIAEVTRLADEAQQRFGFWSNRRKADGKLVRVRPWAGYDPKTGDEMSIRRIARAVGWESEYRTLYSLASLYVHAGLTSVESHVRFDDQERIELSAAPSTEQIELVLSEAFPYLLSIAGEWCKVLRAPEPLWQELRELGDLYVQWYGELIGQEEGLAQVGRLLDQEPLAADER